MYTYLENIEQVKKRYDFPYNLIGKIKDIQYCTNAIPYYQFQLYNDNTSQEYTCIVKETLFERLSLKENDTIVIEYAPINNFMDIGDCFLIRRISKPVMGFTGNKNEDILNLLSMAKKLIETEFEDHALIFGYHSHINRAYLKLRKTYIESRKR